METQVSREIPLIDAHHHLWDIDRFRYDWQEDRESGGGSALLGDYSMIRSDIGAPWRLFREFYGANVVKSIHVEAANAGADPVEETAWLDIVSKTHGMPNALVVRCDIGQVGVETELDRHLAASDLVRGVRFRFDPNDSNSAALRRGCTALGARSLSFELNVSPGNLLAGRDLAVANPKVQFILGHAGMPIRRDDAYFAHWRHEVSRLAEVENVACKVSGLGMADHRWTVASMRPWILHCIEAFGPSRIMFGTNWPVDILYATYIEQTDAYRTIIAEAGFDIHEQEAMLFRNAQTYYRI